MCPPARRALSSILLVLAAAQGLRGEETASTQPNSSQAAQARPASPQATASWTIGIARFTPSSEDDAQSILLSTIPLLVLADMQPLPSRRAPAEAVQEAAEVSSAKARFAAGTDLASKLDDRAAGFLNPSVEGAEKRYGMMKADKAVEDSTKKLNEAIAQDEKEATGAHDHDQKPKALPVKVWAGHAKGMLIDPPGDGVAKAAKAAGVDFLVTGSVGIVDGDYAAVTVHGYDASLGREVFSYSSHCAVDDPAPLALEIGRRLARQCAGRDFTRIALKADPSEAEIYVDGEAVSGSAQVFYVYEPGTVHISASAPGHESVSEDLLVGLNEDREIELKLDTVEEGHASISTTPAGADLSLDSTPIGSSPASIPLDGTRRVLSVSQEGMEPQTIVLPASGEASLDIELRPSDGLGLEERINAAKDSFYWSFGWFALSVPVATLTWGIYNGYDEAYQRSGSPSLEYGLWNSQRALTVACAVTATTAVFMIIRLVKYLKTAK